VSGSILVNGEKNIEVKMNENNGSYKYLLDYNRIIHHLAFVVANNKNIIGAILKHKEGKTFKFIIRNIFFL
jgi:CO/xanthine dehydrogenase FAD-binding subunit